MFHFKQGISCIIGLSSLCTIAASPVIGDHRAPTVGDSHGKRQMAAQGRIDVVSDTTFFASFNIGSTPFVYTGVDQSGSGLVPPSDTIATLFFTNPPVGGRTTQYEGSQGPDSVSLHLDDGNQIEWSVPVGTPDNLLVGNGEWSH